MVDGNRNTREMLSLFLYIFISILKASEGVLECRDTDCVLCDCYNQTQYTQTLICETNQIIRLEFYQQRRIRFSNYLGDSCNVIHNDTFSCFEQTSRTTPVNDEQKLAIYRKCNAKRTCDVNFPTERPIKVVIPYVCEAEADVRRISTRLAQNNVRFPIFYFSGEEFTKGKTLNCECRIGIPETVLIEAFFLNLGPEACKRVIISNKDKPLFICTDDGLLVTYGPEGDIVGDMRIQIQDLVVEGDEVLYFKLRGTYDENMSINCTGCSVTSGPPGNPTASESFKYHIILGTVFGILAVIITTVAVCVLCRLRQRKRSRQRANTPSEQDSENNKETHYDYIDDDASSPNNTNNVSGSHHYLDLTNSTDGYLEPQIPAAEYINRYPTTDIERRDNEFNEQIPLAPRISTDSTYNRAFTSK